MRVNNYYFSIFRRRPTETKRKKKFLVLSLLENYIFGVEMWVMEESFRFVIAVHRTLAQRKGLFCLLFFRRQMTKKSPQIVWEAKRRKMV